MTTPDDSPTAPVDLPPPRPDLPAPESGTPASAPAAAAPPPPPPLGSPSTPVAPGPPAPDAGVSSAPTSATTPTGAGWGVQPASRPASQPANQGALVLGVLLLVVGGVLLLTRVTDVALGSSAWPLWIVVPGLAMLIASFAIPPRGGLALAVPGAIITTVGIVLWFQEANDAFATWAYAWALVAPTAPGVGTFIYGSVRGDGALARDGLRMAGTGLALFAGFALFFEGVLGISGEPIANLDEVLPFAAIGLGVVLVVLAFLGRGRDPRREGRAR
jgi:hypothetical protein